MFHYYGSKPEGYKPTHFRKVVLNYCCLLQSSYIISEKTNCLNVVIALVLQFVSLVKKDLLVAICYLNTERGRIKALEGNFISEHNFLQSKPKN